MKAKKLFLTSLVFLLSTGLALAAGDGESTWSRIDTYKVMNFTVLVVLLYFALRKPVARFLNGRIEGIEQQLADLEQQKLAAEKELAEYRRQLEAMDAEAKTILAEYRKQGEAAKGRILAEAEASAAKMREQAQRNIEHEFARARARLQAEVMETALVRAEALIQEKIGPEDHERLTEEYLKKVVAS
ncbi:ATP synthase F0 subunit B [Desulfobotulus sp.]|jgi:F-type H+-transporting ATPase subunit b|uniref:ATP synthase F0 subunit B n=1 Tax=Desulfobotulus sp. TaxID=1940337 RepID=UPI002A35C5E6|nr:ATP synthase F0 subunit B [Desulfobotulus sp.]MDY0164205.1 ATP synthase F0 subunit B [Desulfobotulus sp.]